MTRRPSPHAVKGERNSQVDTGRAVSPQRALRPSRPRPSARENAQADGLLRAPGTVLRVTKEINSNCSLSSPLIRKDDRAKRPGPGAPAGRRRSRLSQRKRPGPAQMEPTAGSAVLRPHIRNPAAGITRPPGESGSSSALPGAERAGRGPPACVLP